MFSKDVPKGTAMQIKKVLINDRLRASKVSRKFCIPIIHNFAILAIDFIVQRTALLRILNERVTRKTTIFYKI